MGADAGAAGRGGAATAGEGEGSGADGEGGDCAQPASAAANSPVSRNLFIVRVRKCCIVQAHATFVGRRLRSGLRQLGLFGLSLCGPLMLLCPSDHLLVNETVDRVDAVDDLRNLAVAGEFFEHQKARQRIA